MVCSALYVKVQPLHAKIRQHVAELMDREQESMYQMLLHSSNQVQQE